MIYDIKTLIQIYRIGKENFQFSFMVILLAIIGTVYIIRNKDKVIAFAINLRSYCGYLAVEKKFQGKGYGKRLIKKILPQVKSLHVKTNNHKVIKLYQKFGFSIKKKTTLLTGTRYLMIRE